MRITGVPRRQWQRFAGVAALVAVVLAISVPALAADNLSVPATFAGVPQRVRFTGNGFASNEMIAFWITAPDRSVIALDSAQADGLGAIAVTVSLTSDGTWQVTAHGLMSRREIVSRYAVGQATATVTASVPDMTTATVTTAIIATGTDATTATASAFTITPTPFASSSAFPHVLLGQVITVSGAGFEANENISLWVTSPIGEVKRLDGAQAGSNGQFIARAIFDTSGLWHVTAYGLTSGHKGVHSYTVDTTATSTAAPAASSAANPNLPIVLPTFTPTVGAPASTSTSTSTPTSDPSQANGIAGSVQPMTPPPAPPPG